MTEPLSAVGSAPPRTGLTGRALRALGEKTSICFRVNFANGSSFQNREGQPAATFTFRTVTAEWRVWLLGHVGLLESYFDQSLEVEGDFALAFRAGMETRFDWRPNPINTVRNYWHEFRFSNRSIPQAKANAEFHYALAVSYTHLTLPTIYSV